MVREIRPLLLVWLVLMVLLAMTVIASFFATGPIGLATYMAISLVQTALIFWFFMHLKDTSTLIRLVAIGAAVWLIILFALTSADFATRQLF